MVNELKPGESLFPQNEAPTDDVINKDTDKTKDKNKKKRSPAMTAAIVLTFLLIVLMITLALFTSLDEVTNVFDAGKVDIVLTESEWKPEDAQNTVPEAVIPKNPKIVNKENVSVDVFLKVTIPYDYMEIENNSGSKGSVLQSVDDTVPVPVPLYKFIVTNDDIDEYDQTLGITQKIGKGWTLLAATDGTIFDNPKLDTEKKMITYIYAHTLESSPTSLAPLLPYDEDNLNKCTTQYALFDKIKVMNFDESFDRNRDCNIYIDAYGIQSNFLKPNNETTSDPWEVWKIIKQTN